MAEDGFFSRWSRRKAEVRSGNAAAPPTDPPAPMPVTAADAPEAGAVAGLPPPPPMGAPVEPVAPADSPREPAPTMSDVARLTPQSDFTRFVAPGVDNEVKQAAMKRLFADPHFNRMDGLDVYIDDYTQSTPIPMSVLRQMVQSRALGLFQDEEQAEARTPAGQSDDPGEQRTDRGVQTAAGARPDGSVAQDVPASEASTDLSRDQANDLAGPHDEDPDLQLQPDHAAGSGRARPGAGD